MLSQRKQAYEARVVAPAPSRDSSAGQQCGMSHGSLTVVRAHDGSQSIIEHEDLQQVQSLVDLRRLVSHVLDIPVEHLTLLHSQGWLIGDHELSYLLDECAGGSGFVQANADTNSSNSSSKEPVKIWAFNRDLLDADLADVAQDVAVQDEGFLEAPALPAYRRGQPPTSLAAQHASNARSYHAISVDLLQAIVNQRGSLAAALANLKRHYDGKSGGVEAFELFAEPLLAHFRELIDSYDHSLAAIERVKVHPALPIMPSDRDRMLNDFVNRDKMKGVFESCSKTNADLQTRFLQLRSLLGAIRQGSDELQQEFEANHQEDLAEAARDAHEALQRVDEVVAGLRHIRDEEDRVDAFAELSLIETEARQRISYLVDRRRNTMLSQLTTLHHVASLQSSLASAPELIVQLEQELRNPKVTDPFKHLARLKLMVPAYAATVIEIVRRRRYAALLSQHSHSVANLLGKLSAAETKRRSVYRTEAGGKLPWEVRGMDEQVSTVELEIRKQNGDATALPEVSQRDIEDLIKTLDDLERSHPSEAIQEARSALERALTRLEALEADFERASAPHGDDLPSDLEQQLQEFRAKHAALEGELQAERDLSRMREAELAGSRADFNAERKRADTLVLDMAGAKRAVERDLEAERRIASRQREANDALEAEVQSLKDRLAKVEQQAAAESKRANELESSLSAVKKQVVDGTKREEELSLTISGLRDDLHATTKQVDALDAQLVSARGEIIAERQRADDGAAQLAPLQTHVDTSAVEVKELKTQIADLETRRAGAANEAAEAQAALREADRARHSLRQEVERHKTDIQTTMTHARKALKLVKSLNDFNIATAHQLTVVPPMEDAPAPQPPPRSPSPDWESLDAAALEHWHVALEQGNTTDRLNAAIADKVNSLNATTRKWQKECKAYRDRARAAVSASGEKIAFRQCARSRSPKEADLKSTHSFAKGDLALFLPTRNSTAQIWAAFNFGFPHYFLSASGPIVDLVKTREYVIARILSISECTADHRDPSTNPFALSSGTKYFLLEAEPWSPSSRHRKSLSLDKKESPPAPQRSASAPLTQSGFTLVNGESSSNGGSSVQASVLKAPSNLSRSLAASTAPPVESAPIVPLPMPTPSLAAPSAMLSSSPAFLPPSRSRPSSDVASTPPSTSRYGNIGKRQPLASSIASSRRPSVFPASTSPPTKALSTTSTAMLTFASAGSEEAGEGEQLGASELLKRFTSAVHDLTPPRQ